jgi:hypothetical protein
MLGFIFLYHIIYLLFLGLLRKSILVLGEVRLGFGTKIAGKIVKELGKAIPTLAVGFDCHEVWFGLQINLQRVQRRSHKVEIPVLDPVLDLFSAIPGVGLVLERGQPAVNGLGGVTADLLARS